MKKKCEGLARRQEIRVGGRSARLEGLGWRLPRCPLSIFSPQQPRLHGNAWPPCLGPGESGSDGGSLCAFGLAHYVGNEVKQPGGAFVLRGLPLSCQASVYL